MGNACCSAFCSSGNEITMDLRRLEEMVQDPTHLDDLITIIDQRLQAKNNRAQLNTSTQQVGSSSKFYGCINFGKDLVLKMSKRVERNRCMVCCKSAYNRDTRKVVGEVLKGASQIQLLAAGVCVVGFLLDQIEQVSNNREHCIRLLRLLCALARRVKQLDHHLPEERQSLDEAVDFIFHGSVLCLTQMESHRLFRIFQASTDAGDLQTLESQIRNTYADLTIGAVIGVLDNIPRFLPIPQGQGPQPVGREGAKDRLVKLLKVDTTDVSKIAVVVYGFGGIGKTTLASAVFKSLDLKAYKACRIDMDANCTSNDIKQLQQQMLRELFGQGNFQLNSCQQGWDQLTEAFSRENCRIFLFIDNALEAKNLQKLLPTDLSCLPSGIRILVTTRNRYQTEILSGTGLDYFPYEVEVLSFSDSKKLFCEKALGSANASLPPGVENIDVEDIVNMCGGIPLLVELVGGYIKSYLQRLSEIKSLKVFLKESVLAGGQQIESVVDQVYNSLDEPSKEAFLDIVCFFDKEAIREVSAVVGKVQLEVLLDAALVKLSFDDDKEKLRSIMWDAEEVMPQSLMQERSVKVHDVIKERGRWLSQQKEDRILDLESLKDALQDTQKLQKIKGIKVSDSEDNNEFKIEAESLDIMHSSLRVLELPESIKVNGICHRSFESLKFLSVDGNLPMHPKQLKRLAVLQGPGGADSENVDELPASLQVLSLKNSANIPTLLQRFDNLSSLQYLDLAGCDALVTLPASVGLLKSLVEVDLSKCSNLTTLPENIENLSSLDNLVLSGCTELASLPPTLGKIKSLLCLDLAKCSELTFLPDNISNLSTLLMFWLKKCAKLVELPKSFGALSALKFLDLSGCSSLEGLPESFGQLKSLKLLLIEGCHNLKTLNSGFRSLTSLMGVNASSCESLNEEAVDILVEIKSLLFLNIDESPSLIQRWKQIGHNYPLIVRGTRNGDEFYRFISQRGDEGFLHTIEHTLFHGGGRFVGVESDGGQLVDWSWSSFAGEEEEVEVDVDVLLTMCDLSLDCNKSALQIVKDKMEERMKESCNGNRNYQIVYAEAGDSVEKSEEHISQTLTKLLPSRTCACIPIDSRTRQLFTLALYKLLEYDSRYAIQSLHTCIFRLKVGMQRDRKWAKFENECFPDDYEETLIDEGGGFNRLFSALDFLYSELL